MGTGVVCPRGLSVRQSIAARYGDRKYSNGRVWDRLFDVAEKAELEQLSAREQAGSLNAGREVRAQSCQGRRQRHVGFFAGAEAGLWLLRLANCFRGLRF